MFLAFVILLIHIVFVHAVVDDVGDVVVAATAAATAADAADAADAAPSKLTPLPTDLAFASRDLFKKDRLLELALSFFQYPTSSKP